MEKIIWIDLVRNEEVLHRVKEERNDTSNIKKDKYVDWSHLRRRCLLKHTVEGKRKEG